MLEGLEEIGGVRFEHQLGQAAGVAVEILALALVVAGSADDLTGEADGMLAQSSDRWPPAVSRTALTNPAPETNTATNAGRSPRAGPSDTFATEPTRNSPRPESA